jgi:glutamine amidotransferase
MVSKSVRDIERADGLILPGVGAAGEGMKNLITSGLDKIIKRETKKGKPLLGICLGMQLLFSKSDEGNVDCLKIIEGKVNRFDIQLKVPQIGWNQVYFKNDESIFKGIGQNSYFYFVNSFYCSPEGNNLIIGKSNYEIEYCSVVRDKNVYGVQFHPEKSGENGLNLLKNFVTITYENYSSNRSV